MRAVKAVLAVAVVSGLLLTTNGAAQQRHQITGTVLDPENSPVSAVWIRLYRGAAEIGNRGPTGSDGRYQIEFEAGGPITVRYDHLLTDFFKRRHPTVVSSISGARSHEIVKVMPGAVGESLDRQTLLDVLSAYEQVYFLDAERPDQPGTIRGDIQERYKQNVGAIKGLDPSTVEWHQRVRDLYTKSSR